MADDEKTLRIEVVNAGAPAPSPGSPSDSAPPAPSRPSAPPSPSSPPRSPGGSSPPPRPPGPTPPTPQGTAPATTPIGIPNAPPMPAAPGGMPTPPPRVPLLPTAAPGAGAAGGLAASSALGGLVIAAGVATASLGVLAATVTIASNVFSQMVERLGQYDPNIAVASGMSELRHTQADMKQAQQLSGGLSDFTDKRTDLDLTLQRIETSLSDTFLPAINRLLEFANGIFEMVEILVAILGKLFKLIEEIVGTIFQPIVSAVIYMKDLLKDIAEKLHIIARDDDDGPDKFLKDVYDALDPNRADIRDNIGRNELNPGSNPKPRPRLFGMNPGSPYWP